jgi:parallel beta-helix repeat protein
MRKHLLVLCILFALISTLRTETIRAAPIDIWVPDDYLSIQAAINAALPGDTIHVRGGPYLEHVILNKTLSLIGEGGTAVIDGNATGTVIEVRASGVLISGLTLQNAHYGIWIPSRNNCFIENNTIRNMEDFGFFVWNCSRLTLLNNFMTNSSFCIELDDCLECTLRGNIMTDGYHGILYRTSNYTLIESNYIANMKDGPTATGIELLLYASNNTIIWNTVLNSNYGMWLTNAEDNIIYHNNFINNTNQFMTFAYTPYNEWDTGWPDGGNYWSSHDKIDDSNGQYQNQPGSDAICDTPFILGTVNIDKYPLLGPISAFTVQIGFITEHVLTISNSTISAFYTNATQKLLHFNATGTSGVGFCRVDIPNTVASALWQGNYTVLVDDKQPLSKRNWTQGSTSYIYLTYLHSEHEITIIPEPPSFLILPILIIATLLYTIIHKRKSPS